MDGSEGFFVLKGKCPEKTHVLGRRNGNSRNKSAGSDSHNLDQKKDTSLAKALADRGAHNLRRRGRGARGAALDFS
jgi:hypothetical protein